MKLSELACPTHLFTRGVLCSFEALTSLNVRCDWASKTVFASAIRLRVISNPVTHCWLEGNAIQRLLAAGAESEALLFEGCWN